MSMISGSVDRLSSNRLAMISKLVDSVLNSSIVVSICSFMSSLLVCSVVGFKCLCVWVGSRILRCFRWIFCSVDNVRSREFVKL